MAVAESARRLAAAGRGRRWVCVAGRVVPSILRRLRGRLLSLEVTVTLPNEFVKVVEAFAHGEIGRIEIEDWLESHVQALADDPGRVRDLANEAWFLVDDYSNRRPASPRGRGVFR